MQEVIRNALPVLAEINIKCRPYSMWQLQTVIVMLVTQIQCCVMWACSSSKNVTPPPPTHFWCAINTSGWVHVTLWGCDWTLNTILICVRLPEEPLGDHAEAQSRLCGVHPHNHIVLNWAHQVKCLVLSPGTWTSKFYLTDSNMIGVLLHPDCLKPVKHKFKVQFI